MFKFDTVWCWLQYDTRIRLGIGTNFSSVVHNIINLKLADLDRWHHVYNVLCSLGVHPPEDLVVDML